MAEGSAKPQQAPPLQVTTRLFARGLGWSPQQLLASLRLATREDIPALVDFRRRRDWDDDAYLRWRYCLDDHADDAHGQLWLLRTDDKVLAAIGREKQRIHHAGRTYAGQKVMDVQVLPELESSGGGIWLNQMMFDKAEVTLAIGANEHSVGMVKRLFSPLPNRNYCVLPLKSAAMLEEKGRGGRAVRLATAGLDAGWSMLHWRAQRRRRDEIEIVEVDQVSEDWLQPLHASLDYTTACVMQPAEHLHWRLFCNPRARYRLLLARQGGHVLGYIAMRDMSADRQGRSGLHVLDWKTMSGDTQQQTQQALLRAVISEARAVGASKVFTTALHEMAMPLLKRMGFMIRSSPMLVAGIRSGSHPLPGAGGQGEWQITDLSFDNDGGY